MTGAMGNTVLALPTPDDAPDYDMSGSIPAKVWACDHILELNTIDDFLNQPGDPYAEIRVQLIDATPDNVSASEQISSRNILRDSAGPIVASQKAFEQQ
jgi:hypothetical protein